jgi:diguanylate cyclase (GGDEF)-like protein
LGWGRVVSLAALLLFSAIDSWADIAKQLRVYTHARDVQKLSPQEAARAHKARLVGVVTYYDPQGGDLFVQDETAGIYVFMTQSTTDAPLHAGQRVSVQGFTTAGDFSPCIEKAQIKVLGTTVFPVPARPSMDSLMSGKEDGHWVEVEGVVRSGEVRKGRLMLKVSIIGGSLSTVLIKYPQAWAESLIDAKVILHGVVAQLHNGRRQSVGARLMISAGSIRIEEPPPADPFSLPQSSLAAIRTYQRGDLEHRVRVRGIVNGSDPGGSLYIAGMDGSVEVKGYPACVGHAGDVIDVVGFPGSIGIRPALLDSICRWISSAAGANPVSVKAEQVLVPQNAIDPSGSPGFMASTLYDLKLVRMEGTLVMSSRGPEGYVLQLNSGSEQFMAVLPITGEVPKPTLENGSRIKLTGVCLVTYDQYRRAESFHLLLRSADDIVVVERASFWNLQNALRALSVMAVLFLAAVFSVARQAIQLREANASLLRLSFQDGLTGVANRRKFDETLEKEFRQASKSCTSVSLVMLDVDHFKALNDRHGHQRGDACLVQVAQALRSLSLRKADLVARYGGEEFAMILPGSDGEGALAVAERIRLAILDLAIVHEVSPFNGLLSISAGVATLSPDFSSSPASLIALADRALYQSKALGRNRTSCVNAKTDALYSV